VTGFVGIDAVWLTVPTLWAFRQFPFVIFLAGCMTRIYQNPRAWRVRLVQATVWGLAAALVFVALGAADAGALAGEMALVGVLAVLAVGLAIAAEVFFSRYILSILRDGDQLAVTTFMLLVHRTRRFPRSTVKLGAVETAEWGGGSTPSGNNAWRLLRVEGQKLPFVVDVTPPAALRGLG
jgi:hypothetical protein